MSERTGLGEGGEQHWEEEKEKHRNKYKQYLFMHCPGKGYPIKLPGMSPTLARFIIRNEFTKSSEPDNY